MNRPVRKQNPVVLAALSAVLAITLAGFLYLHSGLAVAVAKPGPKDGQHLTIKQVEAEGLRGVAKCKECPQVPFGGSNKKWEDFKAQYKDGDDIVYYAEVDADDYSTWERAGYRLIRDGKEVAEFTVGLTISDHPP